MSTETPELIRARPVPRPSVWLSAAIVAVLAVLLVVSLITNQNYRWDVVGKYLFDSRILSGVGWTLLLTVGAMALGIIMAVTMAIMRMGTNPILRGVSWAYIWFFRGTPIYTQLVFWGLIGTLYPKIGIGDWSISTQDIYNAAFAAILGLTAPPLPLSAARTRWGSCSLRTGIRLNWRLIHFPPHIVDYVVVHELAHLREMNHSPAFWEVVRSVLPDYQHARGTLRTQTPPVHD